MTTQGPNDFVTISDLHFVTNNKVIFHNVNLAIRRGKITAIMGPSGSGKTTLLKLIGAQLQPTAGNVYVEETDIHSLSRKQLYKIRRKMGLLFQNGALFTNLTVFENVAFPLREHTNLPEDMIKDIVLVRLEAVGLRGAKSLMPNELSGGMARRVALARALVLDPQLIMYDEPFTGQDPITMGVLLRLIKKLNDVLELTSIIVSHDVAETLQIADYVYVISNGKIIGEGDAKQVTADTNPWMQQFIHGIADGTIPFHYPAPSYQQDLGL